jgi:hypothetical protein
MNKIYLNFVYAGLAVVLIVSLAYFFISKEHKTKPGNLANLVATTTTVNNQNLSPVTQQVSQPSSTIVKNPSNGQVLATTNSVPTTPVVSQPVTASGGGNSGKGGGGRPSTRIIRSKTADSFVVEVDGASYTIFVKANTIILNNAGKNITFSDLKVGDSIKVIVDNFASPTRAAIWIQDVSI